MDWAAAGRARSEANRTSTGHRRFFIIPWRLLSSLLSIPNPIQSNPMLHSFPSFSCFLLSALLPFFACLNDGILVIYANMHSSRPAFSFSVIGFLLRCCCCCWSIFVHRRLPHHRGDRGRRPARVPRDRCRWATSPPSKPGRGEWSGGSSRSSNGAGLASSHSRPS